ncbi:MAG: hypothetical protein AB7L84_11495 [Acidimicrobiia bacterium]
MASTLNRIIGASIVAAVAGTTAASPALAATAYEQRPAAAVGPVEHYRDLSAHGVVAGQVEVAGKTHPALAEIGHPGSLRWAKATGWADEVNGKGDALVATGPTTLAFWPAGAPDVTPIELPPLPGAPSLVTAVDLNDLGSFVLTVTYPDRPVDSWLARRSPVAAATWDYLPLRSPAFPRFVPVDLNDHDVVVGRYRPLAPAPSEPGTRTATFQPATGFRDVGDWVRSEPQAINDDGFIVGTGSPTGAHERSFVYRPDEDVLDPLTPFLELSGTNVEPNLRSLDDHGWLLARAGEQLVVANVSTGEVAATLDVLDPLTDTFIGLSEHGEFLHRDKFGDEFAWIPES